MATDQTDGEPPRIGSTILVNIGCTANNRSAEANNVTAKTARLCRAVGARLKVETVGSCKVMRRPQWEASTLERRPLKCAYRREQGWFDFGGWGGARAGLAPK